MRQWYSNSMILDRYMLPAGDSKHGLFIELDEIAIPSTIVAGKLRLILEGGQSHTPL